MIDILFVLLIILVNVSAVLNVLLILKVFFGAAMKLDQRILFIVSGIYFLVNVLFVLIPGTDAYTGIFVFVFMVIAISVLSQSHRIKNMLLAIPAALMYVQWGSMFNMLEQLLGLDKFSYTSSHVQNVTITTILPDFILFAVLCLLLIKVDKEIISVKFTKAEGVIITIICIVYPIAVAFLDYAQNFITHPLFKPIWLGIAVLINVAIIYGVAHRKKAAYYKNIANQYKEQFQTEYDYFKDYKKNNNDIIKFRHDWNNHMMLIREMFEKGEYDRANEYFTKLVDSSKTEKQPYVTGNDIVDMILKSKHPDMSEKGIKFVLKGSLVDLQFMEDVDCCILFSNIIDNAIKASECCNNDKSISLSAKRINNLIYIEMENSVVDSGQKMKNSADKNADGKIHGIGLRNVSEIVKKYNGEHSIEEREGLFAIKFCFTVE